ncbi:MAG: FGGY family carbohydrate kinase [Candidatus Limiplasma sp.]|nr:FGGY family carbohydrate kinase [Candidatus Limiplasma sp.]
MKGKAYIGIDLGTTSVKCLAMDDAGRVCASASGAYPSHYPHPGWVEQEPEDWMRSVYEALRSCVTALQGYRIEAVSFSGHMSSPVFLNEWGEPLARCITIADIRSAAQSARLMREHREDFERVCGNRPLDCFAASKLLWFQEERPELYARVRRFVFAKDYVRGQLTGVWGVTDPTDAGNSLLYDFALACWDEKLIGAIGLNPDIFPQVEPSASVVGSLTKVAAERSGLPEGTPVVCGGADMACSQLGTGALKDGLMVITLGTSCQVCMRVPCVQPAGIGKLTFHRGAPENTLYAMASVFSGALSVNWMYQTLWNRSVLEKSDLGVLAGLNEEIAQVPMGAQGVFFLPFLTGSGSPSFDTGDRAVLAGLSNGVIKPQLMRAVMEGVAYNILENLRIFEVMGASVETVRLGGGGTKMPVWSGILADVLGRDLNMLDTADASAVGACILARSIDRGSGALAAISDETVTCRTIIRHSPVRHGLYGKLFEQYGRLYAFMNEWQKTQAGILTAQEGNADA